MKILLFKKKRAINKKIKMSAIIEQNDTSVSIGLRINNGKTVDIDWGDGSIVAYPDVFGEVNHTYASSGEYAIVISGDTGSVLAFGIPDCAEIAFDWDISAFSSIRYIISGGFPNNVLYISKLRKHSTLQGIFASGGVRGDIGDLPLSSLYFIEFNNIDSNMTGDLGALSTGKFASTGWLEDTIGVEPVGITIKFEEPNYNISGDISAVFKPGLKYLSLFNFPASYTTCSIPSEVFDGYYDVRATAITPEATDQLIADFNTAINGTGTGTLKVHNVTPASESARNELSAKGFVVKFDDIV